MRTATATFVSRRYLPLTRIDPLEGPVDGRCHLARRGIVDRSGQSHQVFDRSARGQRRGQRVRQLVDTRELLGREALDLIEKLAFEGRVDYAAILAPRAAAVAVPVAVPGELPTGASPAAGDR